MKDCITKNNINFNTYGDFINSTYIYVLVLKRINEKLLKGFIAG
jgi:hypothetical protein